MKNILEEELMQCLYYFEENTNYSSELGYGLARDKYPNMNHIASISATGYSLAHLPIAIEKNLITYEEGYERTLKTLNTIFNLENKNGFYYHYINYDTGLRELNSEVSIIDTAILLCGVLYVGDYFNGKIKDLSCKIFDRTNWQWFLDKKNNLFYLGYKNRFYGHWDNYAEQLIIYILAVGSKTYPVNNEVYYTFKRNKKDGIIYSWFGSLFTYQYSHLWINFKGKYDINGICWYDNSKLAILANKKYCLNLKNKTFKLGYWGLSATINKKRYSQRLGAPPCSSSIKSDGTISLSGLICSIEYDNSIEHLLGQLRKDYPGSYGKYGFVTSINLGGEKWYCNEYLGIDKGNIMLALYNYFTKDLLNIMNNNEYVKQGLINLNIK